MFVDDGIAWQVCCWQIVASGQSSSLEHDLVAAGAAAGLPAGLAGVAAAAAIRIGERAPPARGAPTGRNGSSETLADAEREVATSPATASSSPASLEVVTRAGRPVSRSSLGREHL